MAEDVGLLAALRADSGPIRTGCSVCKWIKDQPNAAEWDEAFSADDITITAIYRAMLARSWPSSKGPLHTHRQGKHRVD